MLESIQYSNPHSRSFNIGMFRLFDGNILKYVIKNVRIVYQIVYDRFRLIGEKTAD